MHSPASLLADVLPWMRSRRGVDLALNFVFEFVDELAGVALGFLRRGFEPEIVDLRGDAVLAREPAVAEELVVVVAGNGRGFCFECRQQIARSRVKGCR